MLQGRSWSRHRPEWTSPLRTFGSRWVGRWEGTTMRGSEERQRKGSEGSRKGSEGSRKGSERSRKGSEMPRKRLTEAGRDQGKAVRGQCKAQPARARPPDSRDGMQAEWTGLWPYRLGCCYTHTHTNAGGEDSSTSRKDRLSCSKTFLRVRSGSSKTAPGTALAAGATAIHLLSAPIETPT